MSRLKGLKVSLDGESGPKKGIGAKSFEDLLHKVRDKFQLPAKARLFIFLQDGTEVDDEEYFQNLPPQSQIIVSTNNQLKLSSHVPRNGLEQFLETLRWHGGAREAVEQIRMLLLRDEDGSGADSETLASRWQAMANFVQHQSNKKTRLSTIEEDPDWFLSLSTNAKTKEEFLSKSCQARVRGYLAKAESQLKATNLSEKSKIQKDFDDYVYKVLTEFRKKLKENKYYGHYFDRKSKSPDKICDSVGQFLCEGRFDEDACLYNCKKESPMHAINPYESSEARVMFSTWNLDHVIERSRRIVPALIEAIENINGRTLNVDYFHELLFTRSNLKLVHIVCHCKQEHLTKKCDSTKFYKTPNVEDMESAKLTNPHADRRITVTSAVKLKERQKSKQTEPVLTRKRKVCSVT